jgi:hypothetical protein
VVDLKKPHLCSQFILQELKAVETPGVRTWMAVQAKDL